MDPFKPLGAYFGLQLSGTLRVALKARAASERLSESAYVRRLLVEDLAVEGTADREDGRRFVDADVAAACVFMGDVGKLIVASRDLPPEKVDGVVTALERAHLRIVRLIEKAEAFDAATRRVSSQHASHNGASS